MLYKRYNVVITQNNTYNIPVEADNVSEAGEEALHMFMRRWAQNELAPDDRMKPVVAGVTVMEEG